jgi:oxygen-independent coproporphyrinogen-3 oxidase
MNRSHNSTEAYDSIIRAQKHGFNNISIDLIYGLPKQKLDDWSKNLLIMKELQIQHFAAYSLTIENKTKLSYLVNTKKIIPLEDDKVIKQFNLLQKFAKENNYIHYEISNFAKEDFFAKHNSGYWQNKIYLGVGPSAHSFDGKNRKWNVSSNKKYIHAINNKLDNYFKIEHLSKNQHYNEYIMTNLRTIWGVNIKVIESRFGELLKDYFVKEIKKWINKNYIINKKNIYTLSEKGKTFADQISSDMFLVD